MSANKNEISGGQFGSVVQAGTIHGGVWINGWDARRRAELVSAWTGPRVADCPAGRRPDGDAFGHHFHHVVAYNGGPQPISSVTVCVPAPGADLLPGEQPLMLLAVGLVPPGERVEVEIGDSGQIEEIFSIPLEIHFTDADGVGWCREKRGRLHQRPAEAP